MFWILQFSCVKSIMIMLLQHFSSFIRKSHAYLTGFLNLYYEIPGANPTKCKNRISSRGVLLTVCYYHVTYKFQSESTLYRLPECQGTPCSKQAPYLKFKWQQRDSNPQPLTSLTNTFVSKHTNTFINEWLNIRLRTKWLWIRIPLLSLRGVFIWNNFLSHWKNIEFSFLFRSKAKVKLIAFDNEISCFSNMLPNQIDTFMLRCRAWLQSQNGFLRVFRQSQKTAKSIIHMISIFYVQETL